MSLQPQDYQRYFAKGISYPVYLRNLNADAQSPPDSPYAKYIPQNLQRSKRIEKTVQLSEEILHTIEGLRSPFKWLVISEHWCGDASQILPVVNKIAEAAVGMIDLRIVYRDENPLLMDAHLTGTSRSIPVLIQLDQAFQVVGIWGPRPAEAQRLVMELRSNPATVSHYSEELHKWYAKDKQISTQRELNDLLQMALTSP